jgi:hypothetical protein
VIGAASCILFVALLSMSMVFGRSLLPAVGALSLMRTSSPISACVIHVPRPIMIVHGIVACLLGGSSHHHSLSISTGIGSGFVH